MRTFQLSSIVYPLVKTLLLKKKGKQAITVRDFDEPELDSKEGKSSELWLLFQIGTSNIMKPKEHAHDFCPALLFILQHKLFALKKKKE